ncbi:hypothetical protein ACWDBT_00590 [Streptomyces ardesiacus]
MGKTTVSGGASHAVGDITRENIRRQVDGGATLGEAAAQLNAWSVVLPDQSGRLVSGLWDAAKVQQLLDGEIV